MIFTEQLGRGFAVLHGQQRTVNGQWTRSTSWTTSLVGVCFCLGGPQIICTQIMFDLLQKKHQTFYLCGSLWAIRGLEITCKQNNSRELLQGKVNRTLKRQISCAPSHLLLLPLHFNVFDQITAHFFHHCQAPPKALPALFAGASSAGAQNRPRTACVTRPHKSSQMFEHFHHLPLLTSPARSCFFLLSFPYSYMYNFQTLRWEPR